MEEKKKSHIGLKIFLGFICLIVVVAVVIYVTQKDNIDAVVTSMEYSQEDIEKQIDSSKGDVQKTLEEYNIGNLRDFTFEEEEQIRKGQITYEEALDKIMKESGVADNLTVASDDNSSSYNSNDSSNASSSENSKNVVVPNISAKSNDAQSIVAEYAVKLYGLKAQYLGQIGSLANEAKAEYKATKSIKSVASKYMSEASSLESTADSAVDSLLNELKGKLESINADTSVVNKMKSAYEQEKTLKKSYYLSLFQKKGK